MTKDQLDLFYRIDKTFTKILNSLVDSGELAKIEPFGLAILVVLKRFTSFYRSGGTAYARPSYKKIAELTGVSIASVKRHLLKLEKLGYVKKHKTTTRVYAYELTERFLAVSLKEGYEDKMLSVPYVPMDMKRRQAELEYFERNAALPPSSPIIIEKIEINNLQVNIINNETDSKSVNIVAPLTEIEQMALPKWVKDKIQARLEASMRDVSIDLAKELKEPDDK